MIQHYIVCNIIFVIDEKEYITITECFLAKSSFKISLQDFNASDNFSFPLIPACGG